MKIAGHPESSGFPSASTELSKDAEKQQADVC